MKFYTYIFAKKVSFLKYSDCNNRIFQPNNISDTKNFKLYEFIILKTYIQYFIAKLNDSHRY